MTHQIAGVGAAAVAGAALDVPTTTAVVLVSAAWLGSLLPDADMAGSRVYRRTRVERRNLLARAVGALVRLPLRLLVLLPHRGFTHSLAACALGNISVNRVGSMMTWFFTDQPVTDAESAKFSDIKCFGKFFHAMLERGIYLPPSQYEALFVSAAHTDADIARTINAARESFAIALS